MLHQEKIKEVEPIVTQSGRLVSMQGNVNEGLIGRLEIGRPKVQTLQSVQGDGGSFVFSYTQRPEFLCFGLSSFLSFLSTEKGVENQKIKNMYIIRYIV